jgi:hypothetical protein
VLFRKGLGGSDTHTLLRIIAGQASENSGAQ